MMDINVYWQSGKVHKYSTPLITTDGAWDVLEVDFAEHEGVWQLVANTLQRDEETGGESWQFSHGFLREGGCVTREAFETWLRENIARIEIDRAPWWVNPTDELEALESELESLDEAAGTLQDL